MKLLLAIYGLGIVCCTSLMLAQVYSYPLQVNESVMEGLLIHKVPPKFPQDLGPSVQGPVILRASIDKDGNIARLDVVSGHPSLVAAAIDAVKQWRYRPYLLHGEAVEVTTTIGVGYLRIGNDRPEQVAAASRDRANDDRNEVQLPSSLASTLLMRKVPPVYPPLARQALIQGLVVLSIVINKDGEVRDVKLVSGHPMLAPAATTAVKQWRYKPYVADDQPVDVATTVQVNFKIRGPDGDTPQGARGDWHLSLHPPQFVRASEGVMQGLLDKKVDPEYPVDAKEKHVEGTVVLNVDVDDDGNVGRVELVSGHPMLAAAAMDAVLLWRYRPLVLNGTPTAVETTVQVKFELKK